MRRITEVVPAAAIERPITRWAYEIIAAIANDGHKPDPVLVLATAKRQPCSIAADPAAAPSPTRHHQLDLPRLRLHPRPSHRITPAVTAVRSSTTPTGAPSPQLDNACRPSARVVPTALTSPNSSPRCARNSTGGAEPTGCTTRWADR